MAVSDVETTALNALYVQLGREKPKLQALDAYYDGVQRLETLGLAVPPELEQFLTVVNWPRISVDRLEERIDLEGFRLPGQDEADDDLWRVWQANDLDEESQLAHLDTLVFSRSFVVVGSNEADADTPLVTVESPLEMTARRDPRTRLLRDAAKFYLDESGRLRGTLYLPDVTLWVTREGGRWVEDPDTPGRDEHNLGRLPVEQITNRARTSRRQGSSQMADVITLTDAACRALTNAQVATEVLAIPQRWAVAVTAGDFVDPATGEPLTAWETYFGSVWATANKDAKFGQFSAADLGNFTRIVEHYGKLASSVTGYPTRFFGLGGDNPPSAEGIRADESSLIKTAERRHRPWGGSWERVQRTVRRFQEGFWDPTLAAMETLWRDPATPTRAQQADAAVKLRQERILPLEAVWEDLGYSATKRKVLRDQFTEEDQDPLLERISRDLSGAGVPAVGG